MKYTKQKMRVLITGGAGFIGHHIIEHLLHKTNWTIVSLDRLDYSGNLNRIKEITQDSSLLKKRVKIIWHDLKASLNKQIVKRIGKIDYIAHLAAGSHVDRSIKDPMEFVMDNVVGTANLLDYARLNLKSLKKFIYFSTDEVFGPAPKGVFYKEDDRYASGNPYSASKAGIIGMSKSLAIEYAKKNITINCVSPGFIVSDMTMNIAEKVKLYLTSRIPMGKLGTGEDVSNCAAFLSSEQASYITGETIHVNGGMYMS